MRTKKNKRKLVSRKLVSRRKLVGGLNFFSRTQRSSSEDTTELIKRAGDIQLKDFENNFLSNIGKIKTRLEQCKTQCIADANTYDNTNNLEIDKKTRPQLDEMMKQKSNYVWVNTCKNGYNTKICEDLLHTYKKLGIYKDYITKITEKVTKYYQDAESELNATQIMPNTTALTTAVTSEEHDDDDEEYYDARPI
jgi:hypothetical protein